MQLLSQDQLKEITSDVKNAGISFSHLSDDLIDHICCDVEIEMSSGISFEDSYYKVRKKIGIGGLTKIQRETLQLIDKNYRVMKKTMNIFSTIALILIAFGALFKIMHWPGAGIMMTFGFFNLCFIALPAGLYVMKKEMKDKKKTILFISAFIGGFASLIGLLFKVQHWPMASILLVIGTIGICGLFIPTLLISKLKSASNTKIKLTYIIGALGLFLYQAGLAFQIQHWPGSKYLPIIGMSLIVLIFLPLFTYRKFKDTKSVKGSFIFIIYSAFYFILFSIILNLNVSKSVLDAFIVTENITISGTDHINQKNNRYYEQLLADTNHVNISDKLEKLKSNTEELNSFIYDIKRQIATAANGTNDSSLFDGDQINTARIWAKDDRDIPYSILFDENSNQAYALKQKINDYKYFIQSNIYKDKTHTFSTLNTEDTPSSDKSYIYSWESYNFEHIPLVAVLGRLSLIQQNIKIAEADAISFLKKNSKHQ